MPSITEGGLSVDLKPRGEESERTSLHMILLPLPLHFGSGDMRVKKDSNCRRCHD